MAIRTFHPRRVSKYVGEMESNEMGYLRPADIHVLRDLRGYVLPDARVAPTRTQSHPTEAKREHRGLVIDITGVPYVWEPEPTNDIPPGAIEIVEIVDETGDPLAR